MTDHVPPEPRRGAGQLSRDHRRRRRRASSRGRRRDHRRRRRARRGRRARGLLDWVVVIGVALLVAFLVRTFVLAHFVVDGTSMATTLHDGDRVFVNKLSYRLHDPNRGDVVVLHEINGGIRPRPDQAGDRPRPARRSRCATARCSIDGVVLDEPYLDPAGRHARQLRRRLRRRRPCPTTTCS